MKQGNWFSLFPLAVLFFACAIACSGPGSSTSTSVQHSVADDDQSPDDDASPGDDDDDDNDDDDDLSPDDDDDASPDDDDDDDDDDDTAESVWTDPTTGLMWQNGATVGSESFYWADAQNYCTGLSWGGYSGWRLPDIDESRSLIRGCAATDTGGSCGVTEDCLQFSCFDVSCESCSPGAGPGPGGAYWPTEISGNVYWYWSSSEVTGSASDAWGVGFLAGIVNYLDVYDEYMARCVRL
jgi:hypothetical protein